jgi:hypothetical protein
MGKYTACTVCRFGGVLVVTCLMPYLTRLCFAAEETVQETDYGMVRESPITIPNYLTLSTKDISIGFQVTCSSWFCAVARSTLAYSFSRGTCITSLEGTNNLPRLFFTGIQSNLPNVTVEGAGVTYGLPQSLKTNPRILS